MSEFQELSKWMTRERKDRALEAMMPRIMASTTKSSQRQYATHYG